MVPSARTQKSLALLCATDEPFISRFSFFLFCKVQIAFKKLVKKDLKRKNHFSGDFYSVCGYRKLVMVHSTNLMKTSKLVKNKMQTKKCDVYKW